MPQIHWCDVSSLFLRFTRDDFQISSTSALDNGVITLLDLHESLVFYYNWLTLDSRIDLEPVINIGPGKVGKVNKRRALKKPSP